MSKIIFMKYLSPVRPKLAPKLKVLRIWWNLAHWIFQIFQSRFWCQKWFLLNIYHLLGPKWSIVYRSTWLGNLKLLIIDVIVNIILEYPKKTVHNLLLLQIYKEVICEKSPLNLLNKILEKYMRKSWFLVKFLKIEKVLKINSFTSIFQGFYERFSVRDFWGDCFHKWKLLFAVNRPIYLIISIYIKNSLWLPLVHHSFLYRITASGETTSKTFIWWSREGGKLRESNYDLWK